MEKENYYDKIGKGKEYYPNGFIPSEGDIYMEKNGIIKNMIKVIIL